MPCTCDIPPASLHVYLCERGVCEILGLVRDNPANDTAVLVQTGEEAHEAKYRSAISILVTGPLDMQGIVTMLTLIQG